MAGWAVVDGVLVPLHDARVPITDVQFTHGLGVFETLEVRPGVDPGPNLARFAESAAAIGARCPDEAVVRAEIDQVVAAIGGSAWVRLNLTGDGRRQVWATPIEPSRRHVPVRARRATHHDDPLLPGSVKHRSRGAWAAALRRLRVDELLFVDGAGRFTEGTSCAVLAVVDGVVWTARWDGRILRSTTLERLLKHAEALQIPVSRSGPLSEGPWDALYVASTTRSLSPVVELDGRALPAWDPVGAALARADTPT
ncbi:MAG: aminotransferase class IV [Myxococcota bacterium]